MLSQRARGNSISCSPGRSIGFPVCWENFIFFIAVMTSRLSLSSCVTLDYVTFFSLKVCSLRFLFGARTLGVLSITADIFCLYSCCPISRKFTRSCCCTALAAFCVNLVFSFRRTNYGIHILFSFVIIWVGGI